MIEQIPGGVFVRSRSGKEAEQWRPEECDHIGEITRLHLTGNYVNERWPHLRVFGTRSRGLSRNAPITSGHCSF